MKLSPGVIVTVTLRREWDEGKGLSAGGAWELVGSAGEGGYAARSIASFARSIALGESGETYWKDGRRAPMLADRWLDGSWGMTEVAEKIADELQDVSPDWAEPEMIYDWLINEVSDGTLTIDQLTREWDYIGEDRVKAYLQDEYGIDEDDDEEEEDDGDEDDEADDEEDDDEEAAG